MGKIQHFEKTFHEIFNKIFKLRKIIYLFEIFCETIWDNVTYFPDCFELPLTNSEDTCDQKKIKNINCIKKILKTSGEGKI